MQLADYLDRNRPPIWPNLWRRLQEFLRKADSINGFVAFLESKNERIDVLSVMEERGLQDLVKVMGNKVKMIERPEVLGAKTQMNNGGGSMTIHST